MNKVSIFQMFLSLFMVQTGFAYTSYQSIVITENKQDVTWIFLLSAIVYCLILILYNRLYHHFVLNTVMKYIYVVYWSVYITGLVIYIAFVLTTWLFPNTPSWVLVFSFLLVCYYAAISRPETTINFSVLLIPLLGLFIIFLLRATPELHVSHFFPLFHSSGGQLWRGFLYTFYGFMGAELFFIYRKFLDSKLTVKPIIIYVGFLAGIYLLGIVYTLLFFPVEGIKAIPEPLLYILNAQELTFIKRLDIIFVYIWFSWALIVIMQYCLAIKVVLELEKRKWWKIKLLAVFCVIGCVSLLFINIQTVEILKKYLIYFVISFSFLLPFSILILNKWRGKRCDTDTSS